MVEFKGRMFVVDRKGRMYCMSYQQLKLWIVLDKPVGEGVGNDRRKRLVESCGELFMIYRCHQCYAGVAFKVFKLNEEKYVWDEVDGIGDDRILFVTIDGCFFVAVKDIPGWRGNCIVFCRDSFPTYNETLRADPDIFRTEKKTELHVAIFHFVGGDCGPIASYPGYFDVFSPSSEWFSSDMNLTEWDSEKDVETQEDSFSPKFSEASSIKETFSPLDSLADAHAKDYDPPADIQEDLQVEALGVTEQMQLNTTTITEFSPAFAESLEMGVSKTKFEGVDISSDLLPTLEKIWAKHGNILEGQPVRSNDLIAWALESMAKAVIILQNTSGRSLDDLQADYLSSTLSDLQLMRLNVSWLAPCVVKALKMHKVLGNREKLKDTLVEIDKVVTQVIEMKAEFLAEVGGLEQMLDKQRKSVRESVRA